MSDSSSDRMSLAIFAGTSRSVQAAHEVSIRDSKAKSTEGMIVIHSFGLARLRG